MACGCHFGGVLWGGVETPRFFYLEVVMRRKPVNKAKSARTFRAQTKRTHSRNLAEAGRGGWRL